CANVVNLLLARNTARERELALRVALGASRPRLLSQLLAEAILLSVVGGALSVVLALAGLRMLAALVPSDLALPKDAGLIFPVLAFTLAVSLASGIGCGLVPALQTLKGRVYDNLREGMRGTGRNRIRRVLVISEIAFAIIPLVGAGLLIRS